MEKIYLFFLENTVRDIESLNMYKKDVFCTWHHRFQNGQGITKDIICEKYRTVEDAMKWINHAIAENTYEGIENKNIVLVFNTFMDLHCDFEKAIEMVKQLKKMQYLIYILHMSETREFGEYWEELTESGLLRKKKSHHSKELLEYAAELRGGYYIKYKDITEKTGIPRNTLIDYMNKEEYYHGVYKGTKKGKITPDQEKTISYIKAGYTKEMAKKKAAREYLLKNPIERNLWSTIIVYQGTKFKTVSGEVFSYKSSKNWKDTYILNLTINYEENIKSLAWKDVLLALKDIPKIGAVIEKPEALGNIRNVTYIYSIFYQFGLIDVPEDLKEKMGIRVAY